MKVTATAIPDVLLIEPKVFGDARGFFFESYNEKAFGAATGLDVRFVQDNHSRSARGVLRGLHYQVKQPQGKLVRVIRGAVFDVAVDVRRSSPTFGRWVGEELSEENRRQLWIPAGFAHGFVALEDNSLVHYKCTAHHAPTCERALNYACPKVGIEWPIEASIVTQKDKDAPMLDDVDTNFVYGG